MSGFSIEQQRAIALANGRARAAAADPDHETTTEEKTAQIPGSFGGEVVKPPQSSGIDVPFPGVGTGEAALSMATGALGAAAALPTAIYRSATGDPRSKKYEGIAGAGRQIMDIAGEYAYQPRTKQGQEALGGFTDLLDQSKIAGLPPSAAVSLANIAPQRLNAARGALPAVSEASPAAIPGMGAALRAERAGQFPVPADKLLTKGMITRDFGDQQFERETAKNATIGAPIRERHELLNENLHQNMQAFKDATGAEAGDRLMTGQKVDAVLRKRKAQADTKVNKAYEEARASGAMEQPVDVTPLSKYVESHQAEAINAGVIPALESKLKAISKDGQATINDLEEVRKMVVAAGGKDRTNGHYAREINGLIDKITEGQGGEAYKYARRQFAAKQSEFSDTGVIERILRTEGRDRKVALGDVFDEAVLKGPLEDVKAVRQSLQRGGDEGAQAWKELQGQTLQHLYDEATKGVTTDARGNRVFSSAQLNRVITNLDKEGKLDFIFGKKGGQSLRDFRDHSIDVQTFPPGSVNTSNTAATLLTALAEAGSMGAVTGIPVPVMSVGRAIYKHGQNKKLERRVTEHLNPGGMMSLKDLAAKPNRNALRGAP